MNEERREQLAIADNEGVLIDNVLRGGPSDRAGLRDGDVLMRLSGVPVTGSNLVSRLSQIGAGETVTVSVIRNGERQELQVTLGERERRR